MSKIVWINNYVGLGPALIFDGPTLEELSEEGVGVVVDLNADENERIIASKLGIEYYGEFVEDHTAPSQKQLLKLASILSRAASKGQKVFVHCTAGIGRSPTCIAAYLIATGDSFEQACAKIKARRRAAWTDSGAPSQLRALKEFQWNLDRVSV